MWFPTGHRPARFDRRAAGAEEGETSPVFVVVGRKAAPVDQDHSNSVIYLSIQFIQFKFQIYFELLKIVETWINSIKL
jgi:hypothetical protein